MLKDASPLVKIIMLVLIFGMFVFAIWQLYRLYSIQKNGESSMAEIIEYQEKLYNPQATNSEDQTYAPIFTYVASDNKKYTLIGAYNKEKKYKIGDKIKVYYLKSNPKSALLEGSFPWKLYIVLAVLGLIGSIMLIYYLKFPPTSKF